jgi:hypothetical protein
MEHGYAITVSLMSPFSRGSLRLASRTPGAPTVIDPAYYSDQRDLAIVVAGLRIAREIGGAPALAPWRGVEALPGPEVQGPGSLRSYVRTNIRSYSHYAGTCAIGTDERSVVDAAGYRLTEFGVGDFYSLSRRSADPSWSHTRSASSTSDRRSAIGVGNNSPALRSVAMEIESLRRGGVAAAALQEYS